MNPLNLLAGTCVAAIIGLIFFLHSGSLESRRNLLASTHASTGPDPLDSKTDCNGVTYTRLKQQFIKDGYVIFRSCSLKSAPSIVDGAAEFSGFYQHSNRTDKRRQDGWKENDDVMNLAADPDTLELLGYLHGRAAFPFQTLNFPLATQQEVHSDVVHFDTMPIRGLMTAAWVALEDISPDAGPLIYYPGSHKMGMWDLDELGVRMHSLDVDVTDKTSNVYLDKLAEAIQYNKLEPAYGVMKKGESFVWAASLLHGGSKWKDPTLSRKSQVTHYYLTGAKKYWVPRKSVPSIDKITYKCGIPACTPVKWGAKDCGQRYVELWRTRKWVDFTQETNSMCSF